MEPVFSSTLYKVQLYRVRKTQAAAKVRKDPAAAFFTQAGGALHVCRKEVKMGKYILKRILYAMIALFVVSTIAFLRSA